MPPTGVVPAGDRRLGIEVNQPDGVDHADAVSVMRDFGVSVVPLTIPWSFLEQDIGQRDLSVLRNAMTLYQQLGVDVLLSIPTVDSNVRWLPADLAALPMNDSRMIQRFRELLSELLAFSGDELAYLIVANEFDNFLRDEDVDAWQELGEFVTAAVAHVNNIRPSVSVGVSYMNETIGDPRLPEVTASSEAAFLNYYLLGEVFEGGESKVADAFRQMVSHAGSKPLVLKECGYPTGSATGGSESRQQMFIAEVFSAWDRTPTRIPLITLMQAYDGLRSDCEETAAAFGFPNDERFIQFLCTLGYLRRNGTAKPAWNDLTAHAVVRGF